MTSNTERPTPTLPIILAAAAVQGLALYWLDFSAHARRWPATDPAWALAVYALVSFLPLTVQLLAEHLRHKIAWSAALVIGVAFCYFGWHYGANVAALDPRDSYANSAAQLLVVLGLLWLMALPFVQCRIVADRWRPSYPTLFAVAWRNKLTLAEAALFTGLFWLLLLLWAQLFDMLGIKFFKDLFREEYFAYPATALVFGCALHLIGSLTRLVSVVLEQVLNVLKWLAVLAGLILGLFTVALAFKLPGLVQTGARAIGAAWLLWLVAVMVLLVNAAYRDGSVEHPYPRWIAVALRCVVPLLSVVALTAGYAMYLRIDRYGLTVGRFWGCVVAAAVGLYALGYAVVALRRGPWMAGIERINIAAALFLIAVIGLALTPVLSPHRLAAASQFARAKLIQADTGEDYGQSPFQYLRYAAGTYGAARLEELAKLQDDPRAAEIRAVASRALASDDRAVQRFPNVPARLAQMEVFPSGRSLERELMDLITRDLGSKGADPYFLQMSNTLDGLFVDLDGDGVEEFVLLCTEQGLLFVHEPERGWTRVGRLTREGPLLTDLTDDIRKGNFDTFQSRWRTLRVARARFRIESEQ